MGAADARVIAIMQRVVRNVVLHDVAPDHFAGPIGQRTDFYQVELRVPVHLVRCGAVAGLFERRCYKAGTVMARIGDPSSEVFFIASGLASVTIPVAVAPRPFTNEACAYTPRST